MRGLSGVACVGEAMHCNPTNYYHCIYVCCLEWSDALWNHVLLSILCFKMASFIDAKLLSEILYFKKHHALHKKNFNISSCIDDLLGFWNLSMTYMKGFLLMAHSKSNIFIKNCFEKSRAIRAKHLKALNILWSTRWNHRRTKQGNAKQVADMMVKIKKLFVIWRWN